MTPWCDRNTGKQIHKNVLRRDCKGFWIDPLLQRLDKEGEFHLIIEELVGQIEALLTKKNYPQYEKKGCDICMLCENTDSQPAVQKNNTSGVLRPLVQTGGSGNTQNSYCGS